MGGGWKKLGSLSIQANECNEHFTSGLVFFSSGPFPLVGPIPNWQPRRAILAIRHGDGENFSFLTVVVAAVVVVRVVSLFFFYPR